MIRNLTRSTTLARNVTVADRPWSRMKGLLGQSCLPEGGALVITRCNSVHMLFMRFAIDVVFVDSHRKVVGLCVELKPFQLSKLFWKSACAIELPTGTIKRSLTEIGDLMTW